MSDGTATEALLEELVRWTRLLATPVYDARVDETLASAKERQAFRLADGTRRGTEIANDSQSSKASVSGWAKKWREAGIAYENPDGNIQHLAPPRAN